MLKRDSYLDVGLYISRSQYTRLRRRKRVVATLVAVTICSSLLGAFKAQQSLSEMVTQAYLFPSYEQVVLGVMNGDVRMEIGNELFECRGGYLGPAR